MLLLLVCEETTFCLKIPHSVRQTKIPIAPEAACNRLAASGGQSNEPQAMPRPAGGKVTHKITPISADIIFVQDWALKNTEDKSSLFSFSLYLNT